jgi:exosortase F-associated protein
MSKVLQYTFVAVLFLLLVMVRAFESELFYDPYLEFFKNDYLYIDNPRREVAKLTLFTSLRYLVNSLLSLGIIFLVFKERSFIRLAVIIFVFAFFLFLIPFLYFVINPRQEDYYLFFNVRRFLIQPIVLLLLLPAFYYHKLNR